LLTYALPIVAAQALLQLAHAYHALADPAGARATLRQLKDLEHHRPQLGNLPAEADELRSQLDVPRGDVIGVASLTTAELRLLPLLPTHLTLAQISERLFVSRNTVKTQAISVYRKLGVSSRSETVARMHELGLLAPT
jgi:LuxR family maltose regulon positive regulatory protein